MKATDAVRKPAGGKKPRVMIAIIETFPQKQKLMKTKSALKKIDTYKKVYREDSCSETRKMESNLCIFKGDW